MPVYAEDQLLQVVLPDKKEINVRYTHVEEMGKHTFAITTDKENFDALKENAKVFSDLVRGVEQGKDAHTAARDLAYYEVNPEGGIQRVHVEELEKTSPYPDLADHHRVKRSDSHEMDVKDKLNGIKLPRTEAELMRDSLADLVKASGSNGPSGPPAGQVPWQVTQERQR